MICRLSLRLLTGFNRRLIINQPKRGFWAPKIYRTLISAQGPKPNLKPGFKFKNFSTVVNEVHDLVEKDEPEDDKSQFGLRYYLNYMENNLDYHGSIFHIETVKEETKDSKNELILAFRNLIKDKSQMNEESIADFKNKLTDERAWLNYYEAVEIIHDLIHNETLNSQFDKHLTDMLNILDWDCYNRFHENTIDQNLFLAQVWIDIPYELKTQDKFYFKCALKYCYKFKNMSRTQAAVLFYLISRRKKFPPIENSYFLWDELENLFPICTMEEIALISRTISSTKVNGLTHKNVLFILDKLSDEIHNINEAVVSDALQGVQLCLPYYQNQPVVKKFQQSLTNSADKFSTNLLVSALQLGINRNTCDKDLMNITMNRIKNDINNHSLDLIRRFTNVLSGFNISDTEFIDLIIEKIKNTFDAEDKVSIVTIVYHLVLLNHIPGELISNILSTEFQEELRRRKHKTARKLSAFLDLTLDIEKPDYAGPRMNEKTRSKRLREISFAVLSCKKFNFGKHVYTLEEALGKFIGVDNGVAYKVLLPNFGVANSIIKLDKNLKGQEIPEAFLKKARIFSEATKPPDDNHLWLAFRIVKVNAYALDNELDASQQCFNRQLKKIGYMPIVVKFAEWVALKKDESGQQQFVENKIKQALE